MVNGLGVLGWGVGGIEAEAAVLGQPLPMVTPKVVGFRFSGALETGVTATDLVLTVTEILRKHGVVGKLVEFHGDGLSNLCVADRATIGNMSPEYGATAYLADRRPDPRLPALDRARCRPHRSRRALLEGTGAVAHRRQPAPEFTETFELDLSTVEPSVAGPRRPQDRVGPSEVWKSFKDVYGEHLEKWAGASWVAGRPREGRRAMRLPSTANGHDDIERTNSVTATS